MYFKISYRKNPETGKSCGYYRLVESYRNEYDCICHRTILNVGFIDHIEPEQLNKIQKQLTLRAEGKIELFVEETDALVNDQINMLWNRLIGEKRIDHPEVAKAKRKRMVDVDTIRHRDVKEIGSEWMAYQALQQLGIEELLLSLHWNKEQIQLATTQIVSRAIYSASELETSRWVKDPDRREIMNTIENIKIMNRILPFVKLPNTLSIKLRKTSYIKVRIDFTASRMN